MNADKNDETQGNNMVESPFIQPFNDGEWSDTGSRKDKTRCGVGCFHPRWLQIFASKKCFIFVFVIVIMVEGAHNTYLQGVVSTIEKQYGLSSRAAGSLKTAINVGSFGSNFSVAYLISKGHKARWSALAVLLFGISCSLQVLPYFIFNQKYDDGHKQNRMNISDVCYSQDWNVEHSNYAYYCFLISGFLIGVGLSVMRSSGFVYLDDNIRKNIFPLVLSLVTAVQGIGKSMGFLFSSFTLSLYIDLSSPQFVDESHPRWIGAWWIGFILFSVIFFIAACFLAIFPRILPRAAMRKKNQAISTSRKRDISVTDFVDSVKRILGRRIVLLDLVSSTCFSIAGVGYDFFKPKYVEIIFGLSASNSNLLIGFVSLAGKPVSLLLLGFIMTKFKPQPRSLVNCSILLHAVAVSLIISLIFLTCPPRNIQGHWSEDNSWNLTEDCNMNQHCKDHVKYSPVCYLEKQLTFYSGCHAGCMSELVLNGSKVFSQCSCIPNMGTVVSGLCKQNDCFPKLMLFLVVITLFRFVQSLVFAMKKIMRFRYVDEGDKSFYMGLRKGFTTGIAFPGPILYGAVIDFGCLHFDGLCGENRNCWWHNVDNVRYGFNIATAGCISLSLLSDLFLRNCIKGLKMYDEDFEKRRENEVELSVLNRS